MLTIKDKFYIFFKDIYDLFSHKIFYKKKGKVIWGRSPYLDYGPGVRTRRLKYEIEKLSINDVFIYMQSHWPWYEIIIYTFFAKLLNIKVIFNQNGIFTETYNKYYKFHNYILLVGILNSKFIIFQSWFCYESLLKVCPKVIKNRINEKRFCRLLNPTISINPINSYEIKKRHKIIICKHFNNDISYYSNYIYNLIRKIYKREDITEIYIIGNIQNNLNQDEIKKLYKIKKLKIFNFIKNSEIMKLLSKSTIALHLNYGDPCPNFVSEAISFGIPCIVNESGGAKEIAKNASIVLENKLNIKGCPMPHLNDVIRNLEEMIINYKSFRKFALERSEKLSLKKYVIQHSKLLNKL